MEHIDGKQNYRDEVVAIITESEPRLKGGQNIWDERTALLNAGRRKECIDQALRALTNPDTGTVSENKPRVMLPGGTQSISDTARVLGELLGKTRTIFNRSGLVVKLCEDADEFPRLDPLRAATLASEFETVAELVKVTWPCKFSPSEGIISLLKGSNNGHPGRTRTALGY